MKKIYESPVITVCEINDDIIMISNIEDGTGVLHEVPWEALS